MVRIDAGAARPWIDWNGFPWSADACFQGGRPLESAVAVAQASPTLCDQQLTARPEPAKVRVQGAGNPRPLHGHLKFAELWLQSGQAADERRSQWPARVEPWDPAAAAGQPNMAADLRVEDVSPDAAQTSPSNRRDRGQDGFAIEIQ